MKGGNSACRVFLSLAIHTASAQQTAVIRTETRVVLVDTIVTNKQGEYVHDLAAKDFRLWEDNKQQTILSVSLEKDHRRFAAPLSGPVLRRHGGRGTDRRPAGDLRFHRCQCGRKSPDGRRELQRRTAHRPEFHRRCRPFEGGV